MLSISITKRRIYTAKIMTHLIVQGFRIKTILSVAEYLQKQNKDSECVNRSFPLTSNQTQISYSSGGNKFACYMHTFVRPKSIKSIKSTTWTNFLCFRKRILFGKSLRKSLFIRKCCRIPIWYAVNWLSIAI